MSGSIGTIKVRVGADIRELRRGLFQATRSLDRFSRSTGSLAGQINNNISIPFALASAAGVKLATEVGANFTKIETLVGITGETLNQFKDDVKALSGEVGRSQQELSAALFTVTSAGLRGAEAMDVLRSAAQASVIGLGDTQEIARAVTGVMQSYGTEMYSSTRATEILTATIREGNLEASALAPVLGRITGTAAQMGISLEQVASSISTFTRLGVSAEESVTALRGVMNNFLAPSEGVKKQLESMGLSVQDLQDKIRKDGLAQTLIDLIQQYEGNLEGLGKLIPNVRALGAVLGTAGSQADSYKQILDNINNSTGILSENFEKAANSDAQNFRQAIVDLQNAGIELGAAMLPVAQDIAAAISAVAKAFSDLDPETKKAITNVGLAAVAFGGSLKAVSMFSAGLSGLSQSLLFFVPAVKKGTAALTLMDKALNVTKIGLILTAVTAAIVLYDKYRDRLDKARNAQDALQFVQGEATKAAKKERIEVEDLIPVIEDVTKSIEERTAALEKLKAISPEYFSQLKVEQDEVKGLKMAYDQYNANLERTKSVEVAQEKVKDLRAEYERLREELVRNPKRQGFVAAQMEEIQKQINAVKHLAKDFPQWQMDLINDLDAGSAEVIAAFLGVDNDKLRKARETAKKHQKEMADLLAPNAVTDDDDDDGAGDKVTMTEKLKEIQAQLNKELHTANELYKLNENAQERATSTANAYQSAIESLLDEGVSAANPKIKEWAGLMAQVTAAQKAYADSKGVKEIKNLPNVLDEIIKSSEQEVVIDPQIKFPSAEEIESMIPDTSWRAPLTLELDVATGPAGAVQDLLNGLRENGAKIGDDFAEGMIGGVDVAAQGLSALGSLWSSINESQQAKLDEDYNRQLERIEATISDEEGKEAAIQKLNESYDKKRQNLRKKQAQQNKAGAIFDSIINTAVAVTKALTEGAYAGPVLAGIIGGLGAAQTAVIAGAPLAFNTGGKVPLISGEKVTAPTNTNMTPQGDHILALLKSGEAVLNQNHIAALGGPQVLGAIGVPGFAAGGAVSAPVMRGAGSRDPMTERLDIHIKWDELRWEGEELVLGIKAVESIMSGHQISR